MWGCRSDAARRKTASKSGREVSEEDAAARLMNRSSTSVQQNCALITNIHNQLVQSQCVMGRTHWDLLRAAASVRRRCPSCWTAPRQPPKTLTSSVWTKKLIICSCTFHLRREERPEGARPRRERPPAVWAKGRFLRDGGQTNQK